MYPERFGNLSEEERERERWRQCGRKRMYPDRESAQKVVDTLKHKKKIHKSVELKALACNWCGGWHVARSRSLEGRTRHMRRMNERFEYLKRRRQQRNGDNEEE